MTPARTLRRALRVAAAGAALALAAAGAGPALAQPASLDAEARAYWIGKARQVHDRVAAAALREQAATDAYSRMLSRRYPAGEAKQAILDERERARKELAAAVEELDQLEEAARRAGVPQRWIESPRDYDTGSGW